VRWRADSPIRLWDQRVWSVVELWLTLHGHGQRQGTYRYEVLRFWEKYGLAPTLEAFKVKRRTLYHWRHQLRMDGGDLEALNEKSRAPRLKRKRLWPKEVIEEIRRLRRLYPNLSKEKLYLFVKLFCEQWLRASLAARGLGKGEARTD
jgi:hypothetical protein